MSKVIIESVEKFLEERLNDRILALGVSEYEDIAKYVFDKYFYLPSGGREILFKESRFGGLVEVDWQAVEQDAQLRFSIGRVKKSKMFRRIEGGDIFAKSLALHMSNQEYQPNQPKIFSRDSELIFNRWTGPKVPLTEEGDISPWEELLARWFSDEDQRNYFEQWLAMTVVYPERHIVGVPLIRSAQGTGKDFVANEILSPLVGESNFKNANLSQITATHADEIKFSTLVVINELYEGRSKKTADRLKSIVDARVAQVNPKGLPMFRTEVFTNFIVFSNSDNPLFIEEGDRRYWIPDKLQHKVSVNETAQYLSEVLAPWLALGGLSLIRGRLQKVAEEASPEVFRAAPMTDAKEQLTHQDLKPSYKEYLSDELKDSRGTPLRFVDILEWNCVKGRLNTSEVREHLKTEGWVNRKRDRSMKWVYLPTRGDNVTPLPNNLDRRIEAL